MEGGGHLQPPGMGESVDDLIARSFEGGLALVVTPPRVEEPVQEVGPVVQISIVRDLFRGRCQTNANTNANASIDVKR